MAHLYRFVTDTDEVTGSRGVALEKAVNKAALIREAALKSTIFVGVPRVSESILDLRHERVADICLISPAGHPLIDSAP